MELHLLSQPMMRYNEPLHTATPRQEESMRRRAPLPLLATLLAVLATVPVTSLARAPQPAVATGTDVGVRLDVTMPGDGASWQGLVAIPPGMSAHLAGEASGVALGEPAIMHGMQVAPVTIDGDGPAARTVDLAFTPAATAPPARTTIARSFGNMLASVALGGAAVRAEYDEVPGTYLMICSSAAGTQEAIAPLAEWRRRQGYAVEVVSTAAIGGTNTQIKSHIQQVYDTAEAPLAHVVLVGDATGGVSVATWRESISGYYGEGDHEYTRLDGDDVLSDVHIGRLSARSIGELEGIVAKILGYERAPDTFGDPGWFTRGVLVGDPSSSGDTTIYVNQWLKQQLLDLAYTQVDTIWSAPFASRIFEKLNAGASVYAYRGYLGCSGFSTTYIDNLSNQGELPFAIMPTCASGSFESPHTYSEAMLRNPDGGAIGAVGTATIGTHTRYNNCYFHGAWEGALNEPDRTLGYAHTRGKIELYRQYQEPEPDIVAIWSTWNNLMGDPATEMRQALPVAPSVDYPALLPPGADTVPVSVRRSGSPLADTRVTVWREGMVQTTGWTDQAGQVRLSVPTDLAPGPLAITVTGDDLMPHRGELQVGAVDAYCTASGWLWSDGQDGMPDPGESGELSLQITNLGETAVAGVTVDVAARTDGVAVAGAPVAVGTIGPGATVTAAAWTLTLPGDLPDGRDVRLDVIAQGGDGAWTSQARLPIAAPAFRLVSSAWSGQAGQTVDLAVQLRNDGSSGAVGAVAEFASTSPFLLPAGPVTVDLGDVAPGALASASWPLAVAEAAWGGHLAACTVTVTTANGTRQVLELSLTTAGANDDSPLGPGTMGYLAWDDQDPSPDAPVYAWREIDPSHGGPGTSVGLDDYAYEEDDTRTVDLPFTFRYRGRDYDRISICSNGWVSLGHTYLVHWRNWALPAAGSPDVLLAVFWDDLWQYGSGRVYHHHDVEDGVYVVQWSRMRNRHNGQQNCQLILHDPAVHQTATGDGLIVYQYDQVANNDYTRGYATVGIQDGQDGLTYTYYNRYASGARTLTAGRAIAFVPTPPAAAASLDVSPGSLAVTVAPGASTERVLAISSTGAAGSELHWQLAVRESRPGKSADGGLDRDRTVTVVAPNGGEVWSIGEPRTFLWTADGGVTGIDLQLDRGDGWQTVASDLDAALGSFAWEVTGPASDQCRVRVVDAQDVLVSDVSDGAFTIQADIGWLDLALEAGQTPAGETSEVTVAFDATGLGTGTYTAEIVVYSSGGAPVVVPVSLLVDTASEADVPGVVTLAAASPNPFNPRTTLAFSLPRAGHARLTVHDVRGRLVRTLVDGALDAGHHRVAFDGVDGRGRSLPSGTYVYRLVAGGVVEMGRMTLVK
ncbi:hypothetical protein GF314_05745 [bacterium]|nr:hypothetical protein [bacterium]